jgi:truncated hemoglobin YjbI
MTRLLYEKHVPADDLLATAFADMPPGHPQREAMWLAEVFGGPAWYSQRFGGAAGRPQAGRELTSQQRERWVALAMRAADEAKLPADPQFRAAIAGYLEWSSRVPADEPGPSWDWGPAGPPAPAVTEPADTEQPAVALPGPGAAVSFEAHVKPLFRSRDRQSMLFAFDLWSPADVQAHAADILARLENGTMPCDGAWPREKTDVFQRWTDSGFQP